MSKPKNNSKVDPWEIEKRLARIELVLLATNKDLETLKSGLASLMEIVDLQRDINNHVKKHIEEVEGILDVKNFKRGGGK